MSGAHRGMITLELGGQERTIRFTNELVEKIETDTNLALNEILTRMSVRATISAIYLGLSKRTFSGNVITRKTVSKWLDESDHTIDYYITKVLEGLLSYMGVKADDDADDGGEDADQGEAEAQE